MDQKTPNGTDKRSWRERLGVGTGKELPRISEEFKSVNVKPGDAPRAAVRPAPMAPRTPLKPGAVAPEKLADKLKAQRDASEKLAEQRINAARQRAEIKPTETAPNGSSKPKFGFAEEEQLKAIPVVPPIVATARPLTPPLAKSAATMPTRPLVPPPVKPLTPALQGRPSVTSGIVPPRQPLGTTQPIMPPRPVMPQSAPPISQSRFAPSYAQPPLQGYRPIDPSQRYSPPYTPPPLPTRGSFGASGSGYGSQPRLNLPQVPAQTSNNYGADDYTARQTTQRGLRAPQRPGAYRQDYQEGELFEDQRQPRRASAGEYAQAYRDMEQGYEEDIPRSRGPWMLLLLLLAGAVAAGLVWFYYNNVKNPIAGAGGNTPVVQAPGGAVKTPPAAKQSDTTTQPSKKLIYDRIVGDREVLGGDVMQSEEQPIAPGDAVEPADLTQDPATQGGEELTPLPLPPPPGDGAADQQGSLPQTGKQDSASIIPAAGESQAAVVPLGDSTTKSSAEGLAKSSIEAVPVPGDGVVPGATNGEATASTKPELLAPDAVAAPAMKTTDTAVVSGSEVIADPEPVAEVKPVAETTPVKPKKVAAKAKEKSLGAAPVVLVAPGESTAAGTPLDDGVVIAEGGGLYAGEGVIDPAQQPAAITQQPTQKKRRTLADLFRSNDDAAAEPAAGFDNSAEAAPTQKKLPVAPQPEQQQASLGGFVVQLASFQSREQASAEFQRLSAKHASLGGLSPIIREATVGGSTRYRLSAGVLASREQASAVCSKMFAAGARDCQVKQQ